MSDQVSALEGRDLPAGPVLVVGAGPVGMTAALHLARFGVPSVVLEAAAERSAVGSRSICVQGDVLDVLERVGVGWAVVEAGVTWYSGRIFHRGREVVHLRLPEPEPGWFPPFVNTPQTVVEALLAERVAASPLIEVRMGQRVDGVEQDGAGVSVTAGGRVYRGSHCVAADGARSAVRGLLGLPFDGRSYADKFLITDIRADLGNPVPERLFHFDPEWNPGRQVLLHPQPDSVWRVDWQVPDDFDLAAERASGGLDRRIRAVIGEVDHEIVWASSYRFHQRRVPTMTVGRVLLAGDAAHVMSPFGARGMNSGIVDAENAAWKIAAVRQGWGAPPLLTTYDTERSAAAAENLRVTDETMRFLVPATPEERAHRHTILTRAHTDPAARPHINSGRLAEPYWYLDSPLTTPAPAEARAAFPTTPGAHRPPLPGVLCPDLPIPDGSLSSGPLPDARSGDAPPGGPLPGDSPPGSSPLGGPVVGDVCPGGARPGGARLRAALTPAFTVLLAARDGDACQDSGLARAGDPGGVAAGAGPAVIRLGPEAAASLGIPAGGAAVVRPDGYLAAVLSSTAAAPEAVARASGHRIA